MVYRKSHNKIYKTKTSVYWKYDLKLIKKQIFPSEKMKNYGNCIYDYFYSWSKNVTVELGWVRSGLYFVLLIKMVLKWP